MDEFLLPITEQFIRENCPMQVRQDDAVAFVQTDLQAVMAETYDKLYPELDAFSVIPISSSVPSGASTWAYDSMEKIGKAKWIGSNARDLPRADVARKRVPFPIHESGISYAYTRKDIRAAAFSGVPLERERGEAARRGQMVLVNEALFFGEEDLGLSGFLNNPAIALVIAATGDWANATGEQIVADLNALADQVWIGSKKIMKANAMCLPLAQYRLIQTKRMESGTDTSVMEYFLRNYGGPMVVYPLVELEGAGVGGSDRAMAFVQEERAVKGIVPLDFTQYAPQEKGLEIEIPTEMSCGGTVFPYPMSAAYMDGI